MITSMAILTRTCVLAIKADVVVPHEVSWPLKSIILAQVHTHLIVDRDMLAHNTALGLSIVRFFNGWLALAGSTLCCHFLP
jgi:hypothetical protein